MNDVFNPSGAFMYKLGKVLQVVQIKTSGGIIELSHHTASAIKGMSS